MLCISKQHLIYSYGKGETGGDLPSHIHFDRAFIYKHILKCHTPSWGCQINVRGPNKFRRLKSGKKGNGLLALKTTTTTDKLELESRKLPPLRVTLSGLSVYLSDTDNAAIFVSKREKQKRFVSFRFFSSFF